MLHAFALGGTVPQADRLFGGGFDSFDILSGIECVRHCHKRELGISNDFGQTVLEGLHAPAEQRLRGANGTVGGDDLAVIEGEVYAAGTSRGSSSDYDRFGRRDDVAHLTICVKQHVSLPAEKQFWLNSGAPKFLHLLPDLFVLQVFPTFARVTAVFLVEEQFPVGATNHLAGAVFQKLLGGPVKANNMAVAIENHERRWSGS